MNTDQTMNLLFLVLLGGAIAASYFVSQRGQLGKMVQQAAIWALIFIGAIAVVGMWDQISQTVTPRQAVVSDSQISVPRAADGHYHLTLGVNGVDVDFVIDTGATQIVLSQQDARRVGLDPEGLRYIGSANTANGVVDTAPVRLAEVTLGPIRDSNVPAVVNAGAMEGSLLGMTYLGGFSSIEIRDNQMLLSR